MKIRYILSVIVLSFTFVAYAGVSPQGRNNKINRVHPPRNSEQYAREAMRVRTISIGERIGLNEQQIEKMLKAGKKKIDSMKKQEEKLSKAEQKLEKEKESIRLNEDKITLQYGAEVKKILTPEQYDAYMKILEQEAKEELEEDSSSSTPREEGDQESAPDDKGCVSPIIKGPNPPLMYKK